MRSPIMAAEKQLIVVVEGTAALGPYWHSIVSDYLHNTIRWFSGMENGQRVPASNFELSLVTFNSHGSNCACLVQRSGWTRNVDVFMQWMSSIQFAGGGFSEAATAEGLAEALMMFSPPLGQAQPSNDFKRHCILVAASNPHTLPTPVYQPQLQNVERNEHSEEQSESRLSDAETVAKYFSKCSVSLSVICPKQLLKIRAIYNAGNLNPQTADLSIDTVKNPFYLVLISENFVEARAALGQTATNVPQIQISLTVDMTSIAPPPVTEQPRATVASANGSVLTGQSFTVGNVQNATVPGSVTSVAPLPSLPHIPSVGHPATQIIPGMQSSSASPVSQEMVSNAESVQDISPVVGGMTQSLHAGPPGGANVSILNNLSEVRQVMSPAAVAGATSSVGQSVVAMHMPNTMSTGVTVSSLPPQTVNSSGQQEITSMTGSRTLVETTQVRQTSGPTPYFSPMSHVTGSSNLGLSQPMPRMSRGSHPGAQMVQGGIAMNQTLISGIGQANVSSPMMHTPGIAQQVQSGTQLLRVNNSSASNMQFPQPSSGAKFSFKYVEVYEVDPSAGGSECEYVKVWEGNLFGLRQGQPVLITRLEAYSSAVAYESLAANWPPTMQILHLTSLAHIDDKQYVGKAEFVVFKAMSQHGFLRQLREKYLCAVIQLPTQTLLLSVSDTAGHLMGLLVPKEVVLKQPQILYHERFEFQDEPCVVLGRAGLQGFGQVPRRSQGPPNNNMLRPRRIFMG